jgi:Cft2 family RNA processing exonuclease
MWIKFSLLVWGITILAILAAGGIMSTLLTYVIYPDTNKNNLDNSALQKTNKNNKYTAENMIPISNKNGEIFDASEGLLLINVIQRVLENFMKTNSEIFFMAVYWEDGTILAHSKPERIGKNMFDVDVEFSDYMDDISEAMSNRVLYKGVKYDPLLNENIKFIVKPFNISNFDDNFTLLIGIY